MAAWTAATSSSTRISDATWLDKNTILNDRTTCGRCQVGANAPAVRAIGRHARGPTLVIPISARIHTSASATWSSSALATCEVCSIDVCAVSQKSLKLERYRNYGDEWAKHSKRASRSAAPSVFSPLTGKWEIYRSGHFESRDNRLVVHASDGGWEDEIDEDDLRTGLNEVANKSIRVMLSGDIQALAALKEEVSYYGEFLTEQKKWDAALFMLVLQGMLDHKLLPEVDKLEGMYKAAFEKIGQMIDDSGWGLAKPGSDIPGEELVDDELIPPVLQTPY